MAEYNVFVVPAELAAEVDGTTWSEQMKKDPASVKWGGGSKGLDRPPERADDPREAGRVDVAEGATTCRFKGGGEGHAAVLAATSPVGTSGWGELQEFISTERCAPSASPRRARQGRRRADAERSRGVEVEIGNWRGVYARPGHQRRSSARRWSDAVIKATQDRRAGPRRWRRTAGRRRC
jgi:putative tricarboxylic transport membrane protein